MPPGCRASCPGDSAVFQPIEIKCSASQVSTRVAFCPAPHRFRKLLTCLAPSDPVLKVPILESERLKLRGYRLEDFSHCAAMSGDSEVARYIGGKPLARRRVLDEVPALCWPLVAAGLRLLGGRGKGYGRFCGRDRFCGLQAGPGPSLKGIPEIGWVLASHAHGRGFATEAVRAAVAWGDVHFAQAKTACIIDPENLASIRVAEKCGYREFQRATSRDIP